MSAGLLHFTADEDTGLIPALTQAPALTHSSQALLLLLPTAKLLQVVDWSLYLTFLSFLQTTEVNYDLTIQKSRNSQATGDTFQQNDPALLPCSPWFPRSEEGLTLDY